MKETSFPCFNAHLKSAVFQPPIANLIKVARDNFKFLRDGGVDKELERLPLGEILLGETGETLGKFIIDDREDRSALVVADINAVDAACEVSETGNSVVFRRAK